MSAASTVHLPLNPNDARQWWRTAVIYQIYPRSFQDSDGDGYGDLPGIVTRLDHLAYLGVDAIWLSPCYRSPQNDGGYDVSDYRMIDPLFGTLADADRLIAAAHKRGLRVLFDLVPNHTSNEHPWFQAALGAEPGSPERGRYLFRDGKGPGGNEPPNNWRSVLGAGAWTRITEPDGRPGQWYLHLFDETQPDLDWTNPEVRAEFEDILRFWLRRGVDGFRVDVAHGLVKADGLPDYAGRVAMVGAAGPAPGEDPPARHPTPMFDQEGVHEVFRAWRRVLDEFDQPGQAKSRALVAEAWVEPPARLARYLREDEMQQAFNFEFLLTKWDAASYRAVITESLEACDSVGAPTTWVLSNHDVVRHPSRLGLPDPGARPNGIFAHDPQPDEELGLRRGRAATLFTLALPGSMYLYQGEELGLPEHTALPDAVRQAPEYLRTAGAEAGRDGCRVPMVWEAAHVSFGFSATGASWLPQPAAWAQYAADVQRGCAGSTLELYRAALALRQQLALGAGGLQWLPGYPDHVLAFRNYAYPDPGTTGRQEVVVLANLGTTPIPLPTEANQQIASVALPGDGTLPPNTTTWLFRE